MNRTALFTVAAIAPAALGQLEITEAYTGLSGPDGTADWVELTNFGNVDIDLTGYRYDDESANFSLGSDFPAFNLAAGASVIILVDVDAVDAADEIADFEALWGTGIDVIATAGGSLGGGGDTANIFDNLGNLVDTVDTTSALSGEVFTIQFDAAGNGSASQLGVNGAFASNTFTNDNFIPSEIFLIGNPGFVPTPAAGAALGIAGIAAARRRR